MDGILGAGKRATSCLVGCGVGMLVGFSGVVVSNGRVLVGLLRVLVGGFVVAGLVVRSGFMVGFGGVLMVLGGFLVGFVCHGVLLNFRWIPDAGIVGLRVLQPREERMN
jgi:hypothetical protein